MRTRVAIGLLAAALVLSIAAGHRGLSRAAFATIGLATGYSIRVGDVRVVNSSMVVSGLHVECRNEPLLDADRVRVAYDVRGLLPGSARRYGLVAIEVERPILTLVRGRDGTFNVNVPPRSPIPRPQRVNPVPLRFAVRIRDGSVVLREPFAYDPSAKELRAVGLALDGNVDSAGVTRYRLQGAFAENRPEPFSVVGRIDATGGYAIHHARAADFPLRALANYFADTPEVRILHASGRNLDAKLYALGGFAARPAGYHANLTLDVTDGRLAMRVLAAPVERLTGHLQVVDDAFFVRGARAMVAGIPLKIDGGAYDITGSLTGRPQLRLGLEGTGNLSGLRRAFAFARGQPISGRARLGVLVSGPIADPVIAARVTAAHAAYRAMPFDRLRARVVYNANVVALAPLQMNYGGVEMSLRGTLGLGKVTRSQFALHVRSSASNLQYLNEMLGDEPIVVDAAMTGRDLLFDVSGSAASLRGANRVAALIAMHRDGTAAIAPFWLDTPRGNLEGGYVLDRPGDTSAFWIAGRGLQLRAPFVRTFPGLTLPSMPPIDGRSVDVDFAGGGSGKHTVLAGRVGTGVARIAGVPMYRVSADLSGSLGTLATKAVRAAGPWGEFGGNGEFSSRGFAAYGAYRGTLEGLQPYLGAAVAGHGPLHGTVGIAIEPHRIVVSGVNLSMDGATLRGIPVTRADLTLAVEGSVLRLFSARAHAAGGDVVAAGSLALADARGRSPQRLGLVAARLQTSQLRGIGLPLSGGTLDATGALAAGAPLPRFDGAVSIERSHLDRFTLSGNGAVSLAGDAVSLTHTLGALGGTYTDVNGSIGALTSRSPLYALTASVAAAPIGQTLQTFGISGLANYPMDGIFNARLRIAGRGARPVIFGNVAVPGGELNGLPFINGRAYLSADTAGVAIEKGAVLVGTTAAHFAAVVRPNDNAVAFEAPHARLADLNNFFDTGDTLGGNGKIKLLVAARAGSVASSGDVDVRGLRYRNLPIGDTRAVWTSAHNTIRGTLAVGGNEGRLRAGGSISMRGAGMTNLTQARFDMKAAVNDLDLALWMPALGLQQVPITGRAFGNATLHGRFPSLNVRADASITDGTLGPLTLDRADLAVHAARRRMFIDRAQMVTPDLTASASGSFGLEKNQPLSVRVQAQTQHLATLAYRFTRRQIPVSGFFESTLDIGGTYRTPSFSAGFDANDVRLYGVAIATLFGEFRLKGRSLVLSNAGATVARGDVTLAGSLPLRLSPLALAAPDEPLSFDLDLVGVDPAAFDSIFGNGTQLGGALDGHIGVSGTIGRPAVIGRLALSHGSYRSDLERAPITAIAAALSFNHTSATLSHATARVGNGNVVLSGQIQFPKGFSAQGLSLNGRGTARGAQLDLPAYGSGTLDAKIAVAKTPQSGALLSGAVTLSNATLPFATFLKAAGQSSSFGPAAPPLEFDLDAVAGKNVRVRGSGYGAGLDIGAAGRVHLGGTLAAPTLSGTIASTGGTLTYFDRAFRVQQGTVEFVPADGIIPTLHAVGTTSVVNPDPDRARNPYGNADITIAVDGPISALKIGLSSNPAGYSRDEILGLIAPFGGFVNGIAFSRQSMLARQQPDGFVPLGALSPIPDVSLEQRNTITVGQEAFNLLNAQFTAGLLAPLESALGAGLGLTSVNLTLGYYGNVGVTATRLLGKAVSLVYAVTFGIPQVQSFGLMVQPNAETSARLNFFYQSGPTKLLQLPNSPVGYNAGYFIAQPLIGNTGFSLSVQRYFW
ncbi:MAG: translocation/assembly module TamB domain-containing protein [Candidatus Eremiobacteraeota bacterium]|nr:translocation/assembly module TamB domain-containing protein [Candidatus Eremiobacteraeota bacterium]